MTLGRPTGHLTSCRNLHHCQLFLDVSVYKRLSRLCLIVALHFCQNVQAQAEAVAEHPSVLDAVQVTATRFAEPIQEVPSSITIVSGDELRARGADELRTALSLVAGVTVAPGGDSGPAGANPGLLGLREVDDFLLTIDGIPVGGAFVPQFEMLDLSDIERIEIQRGTAPVFYGTTAFAGTINIIHYAAGSADRTASGSFGSYGTVDVHAATVLSDGAYRQSLSATGEHDRYSDSRAVRDRAHMLYRLGADAVGGKMRLDLDMSLQMQKPSSPRPFSGSSFADNVPLDFNQNPADGKIETNRFQLSGGYDRQLAGDAWSSILSVAQTRTTLIQGFFNSTDDTGYGADATGFAQQRGLTEIFVDTHLTHRFQDAVLLTMGINELYGRAAQSSNVFGYQIPSQGSPPSSAQGMPAGNSALADQRSFAGVYAQSRWAISTRISLLAGLRLNHTDERRTTRSDTSNEQTKQAHTTRLNGSVGGSWQFWSDPEADLDDAVVYLTYSNTFQPSQIDFGPDAADQPLLHSETERSYELGIKADGNDGRLSFDLAAFFVDFANQTVATQIGGTPSFANGGKERFKGLELELEYQVSAPWSVTANYSWNDARYRDFLTVIDAAPVQLSGKQVPLTSANLAALGVTYRPPQGMRASLTLNLIGERFLDMQNAVSTRAYLAGDASIGYTGSKFDLALNGYNLTNRRDPVLASELGEGQYYLLRARRLMVRLTLPVH